MLPFISAITPPAEQNEPAYWLIFRGYQLLVHIEGETAALPYVTNLAQLKATAVASRHVLRQIYLGYLDSQPAIHCYAVEIAPETEPPPGMALHGLRSLFGRLPDEHLWLAGRAVQIVDWDRTHQFCSRCSTPTEMLSHERAKKCPSCGMTTYPRLSPAIIVRVDRQTPHGRQLLLARNHRYPPGWYSVLAGFVEPGETLEECVQREIREEVNIEVKNIRYFGSQPWPFPHSLMIAFTAEYANGDITPEETELEDARWFTADTLPQIPTRMSIARQLIDDFVEQYGMA